jgi:hypothetical protein
MLKFLKWLFILLISFVVLVVFLMPSKEEKAAKMAEEQKQKTEAANALAAEFDSKNIRNVIDDLSKNGRCVEAIDLIDSYYYVLSSEQKISIKPASYKCLIQEVKKIPANKFVENFSYYTKLNEFEPSNKDFSEKLAHYGKAVEFLNGIKSQINTYGYYPPLVKIVKQSMKNPDSYEHSKTFYSVEKDGVVITMEYFGRNSFNAKVRELVKLKLGLDGKNTILN